jgi:arginyl-tRNA synthetase
MLKEQNLTYSKDNALWFRATAFGDSDDRVIITSDGRYTYLMTDIAYHFDKIERKHDTLINIWGPDHHGRIKGLTGGMMALHYPKDIIKIIIVQEVKLRKDGKILSMSKRAGRFEKLEELLDQVPKDVVRFFMLMRSNSQHLDFDLDLALKESEENPVYYVQYAYARIQSIIAFAKEHQGKEVEACDLSMIKTEEEIALVKTILKFSEILEDTARSLEPYHIAYYLVELARTFHYFYQKHRVVSEDTKLTKVRLELIKKTAETFKSGLEILGISCPERM